MSFINLYLEGNLGQDPKIKYVGGSGLAVCEFSVAHNTGKKEQKLPTKWFNCVAFEELAEKITEGYKKGSVIEIIKSFLKVEEWNDKTTGEKRTKDVWIVQEIGEKKATDDKLPF